MPEVFDLLSMQRDFLGALREPLLGEGRAATALPARAGLPSRAFEAVAAAHLLASPTLDAVERLDLYHRQYWYRVLDSLEEDFPALKALLGDDRFRSLMEDYLEATPSRSCTLRHLGSQLAAFVAANPHLAGRHAVAAFELAQLEYALCLAFEAEEREPASLAQLEGARLALQPHVQLFALRSQADEVWAHATTGERNAAMLALAAPTTAPGRYVVVFRDGFEPAMETVSAEAFRLLSALRRGATLADAITAAGLDAADAAGVAATAASLPQWFALWISRRWLTPAQQGFPG